MSKNSDSFEEYSWPEEYIAIPQYLSAPNHGSPGCSTSSTKSMPSSKHNPDHYQMGKIQVWDFIIDQDLDFVLGNVVKYVCRAGTKPGESRLDDLLKAQAYINKAIESTDV